MSSSTSPICPFTDVTADCNSNSTSPDCPLMDVTTEPNPLDASANPRMSVSELFNVSVNVIVLLV